MFRHLRVQKKHLQSGKSECRAYSEAVLLNLFLDRVDREERALCRINGTHGKRSPRKSASRFGTAEAAQVTGNASGEDHVDSDREHVSAQVREKYQLLESTEDSDALSDGEASGSERDLSLRKFHYKGK